MVGTGSARVAENFCLVMTHTSQNLDRKCLLLLLATFPGVTYNQYSLNGNCHIAHAATRKLDAASFLFTTNITLVVSSQQTDDEQRSASTTLLLKSTDHTCGAPAWLDSAQLQCCGSAGSLTTTNPKANRVLCFKHYIATGSFLAVRCRSVAGSISTKAVPENR